MIVKLRKLKLTDVPAQTFRMPVRRGRAIRWSSFSAVGVCLLTSTALIPCLSSAQEALINFVANQPVPAGSAPIPQEQPYTLKSGNFRLLVTPSLGVEWNSNIYQSETDVVHDYIVRPFVQFDMSYPLTDQNALNLNLGIGYNQYLINPDFSSLELRSLGGLSVDVYIKDVRINLHERPQYSQSPPQPSAVANTAVYSTFVNTIGALATWDLQELTMSLGYDHQNTVAMDSQYHDQNQGSELLVARAGYLVHPQVTVGLEGTGSFTAYTQPIFNDNTSASIGMYADWQPGAFFHVLPRFGYTYYFFRQTSLTEPAVNSGSYYFDLTVRHDLSEAINYSVSLGHNLQLGYSSDLNEVSYFRPNINWQITENLDLTTYFGYDHGLQGDEIYDWVSAGIGLSHPLTDRLNLALNYRYTWRSSDQPDQGYTQNFVGLVLSYRPD